MYILPQVEWIENDFLTKTLASHGYYKCWHTPGVWRHKWGPVNFYLVLDDFWVKYFGKQHAEHLITCIKQYYPVSVNLTRGLYCGVILDWEYIIKHVTVSMAGYMEGAIHEYQHKITTHIQHAPHKWERKDYGAKNKWQRMILTNLSSHLKKENR